MYYGVDSDEDAAKVGDEFADRATSCLRHEDTAANIAALIFRQIASGLSLADAGVVGKIPMTIGPSFSRIIVQRWPPEIGGNGEAW